MLGYDRWGSLGSVLRASKRLAKCQSGTLLMVSLCFERSASVVYTLVLQVLQRFLQHKIKGRMTIGWVAVCLKMHYMLVQAYMACFLDRWSCTWLACPRRCCLYTAIGQHVKGAAANHLSGSDCSRLVPQQSGSCYAGQHGVLSHAADRRACGASREVTASAWRMQLRYYNEQDVLEVVQLP